MDTDGIGEVTVAGRRRVVIAVAALVIAAVVVATIFALRSDGPRVLALTGGGSGDAFAAMAESDAAGRAEMTIWNPVEYRFELGDGARFDGDEARAWMLEAPSDLEAAANDLADRFGLDAVTPAPYDDASFMAGSEDGTGPGLWVGSTGDWSYYAPDGRILWDCVEPLPEPGIAEERQDGQEREGGDTPVSDDTVTSDEEPTDDQLIGGDAAAPHCEPPAPPEGVPSVTEARSLADALFADLAPGRDVVIQDARSDEWGAWVHATILLDGEPTDLSLSAGWGGDAALTNATGTLAVPVEGDLYPTLDADGAVERLAGHGGGWGGLPTMEARPLASDTPATTELPEAEDVVGPEPETLPAPDTRPAPGSDGDDLPEGEVEPEVVTVTLTSVEPVLMLHWDAEGTTWLLPGYRFTDADGGLWQVLAITDEYLETADPQAPGVEPDPAEPGTDEPGAGGGSEPGQPGEVAPSEPGDGSTGSAGDPDTGEVPPDLQPDPRLEEVAHSVVGMAEDEAVASIEEAGGEVRIVERDGESFPVTDDLRTDRVNLTIADGIVRSATVG